MAFTKSPTQDTHSVVRIPPTGEAFQTSNYLLAAEPNVCNYLDCFPKSETQWGQNPRMTIQRRDPFIKTAAASGTVVSAGTLGKALVVAPDPVNFKNVFFNKGSNYYMFNYSTFTVSSVTTSTTPTVAQYASGTDAIDSTGARRICWLDPTYELKTFLQDGTSVTTTNLAARAVDGAKGLVFIDGYLFAVDSTGTKIFNSAVGGVLTTWNSTDWLDAEQYGDPVLYIDKHRNMLVAFGSKSIEFFYNAGIEVGSPLARQESYSRQIGIYTQGTTVGRYACKIEDDIYFIGYTETKSLGLYRIRNFQVEQIDSAFINQALNQAGAIPHVSFLDGVETIMINHQPMVMINMENENYNIMYSPRDNVVWMMRFGADGAVDYPEPSRRFGRQFYTQELGIPMFCGQTATNSTLLQYYIPDWNHTTDLTCAIWTQPMDLGSNRTKHFVKIEAIGDFGQNNSITLKYVPSPTYDASPVTCSPSVSPGLNDNPIQFFNIGGFRRPAFIWQITGRDQWVYEGMEIEYNIGVS